MPVEGLGLGGEDGVGTGEGEGGVVGDGEAEGDGAVEGEGGAELGRPELGLADSPAPLAMQPATMAVVVRSSDQVAAVRDLKGIGFPREQAG